MSLRGVPLLTLFGFFIVVILLCPNVVLARAPKAVSGNVTDAKAAKGGESGLNVTDAKAAKGAESGLNVNDAKAAGNSSLNMVDAKAAKEGGGGGGVAASGISTLNVIDACWRKPNWKNEREHLASCSVGFAGKMVNNVGQGIKKYVVTDPSDHPTDPKPETLRYGATMIKGKVWITFQKAMTLKLEKPILVSSCTAIDGRGSDVQISNGAGIVIEKVNNVIIHGLSIHHCTPQAPGKIMGPEGIVQMTTAIDGDAIRVLSSSKVWIDHNTMSACLDGIIDVTLGSTDITISNNRFSKQDKVVLLGHDDAFKEEKNMKVTVAFNHFGPGCHQRMPRVRHGYAHVVNNLYLGWGLYAIGGSANPSVKSQANLFLAPDSDNKEVTWKENYKKGDAWSIHSVGDVLENGAVFSEAKDVELVKPNYTPEQDFPVAEAGSVRTLTKNAGVLNSK